MASLAHVCFTQLYGSIAYLPWTAHALCHAFIIKGNFIATILCKKTDRM